MPKFTDIKYRIDQMEGGAFQELCDALLTRLGYERLVEHGLEAGTQNTTIGNPDTYFQTSTGKYTFVAYTTQKKGLFEKAQNDITNCLSQSKTGLEKKHITEIIFCHTSSRLSPGDDKTLHELCKKEDIHLEIYGINRIADEIYRSYPVLARDFLGISLDSGQIMTAADFVRQYDANQMAAPLSTVFQFREKEYSEIITALKTESAIVVCGQAGVGKSRLAIEAAKAYADATGCRLFCIRDLGLPIAEDLMSYIDSPGDYLLFADDANELSNIKRVLEYLIPSGSGKSVKLIATLRDYTASSVITAIGNYAIPYIINIPRFTDQEIIDFLDVNLGIKNTLYTDTIIRIAEGNPRIAYMAGRIAKDHQSISSISNVESLYDQYYEKYLSDSLIMSDRSLCLIAGIVSICRTIDLNDLRSLQPFLVYIGMEEDTFRKNIDVLFHCELVDIKLNRVISVSDQCLANYLPFLSFFKKKFVPLRDLLVIGFEHFRSSLIKTLNTVYNLYQTEDIQTYIQNEVCVAWDMIRANHPSMMTAYVKTFSVLRPEEALLYVQKLISQLPANEDDISSIDFSDSKYEDNDDIIDILSTFRDLDQFPMALQLICQYVLKCHNIAGKAYRAIISHYSVNQYSHIHNYDIEKTVIQTMRQTQEQPILIRLYLAIASHFCRTFFEPAEFGRNHTLTSYMIPVVLTEESTYIRQQIWDDLYHYANDPAWQDIVAEILQAYSQQANNSQQEVVAFDQKHIISILEQLKGYSSFKRSLLFKSLERIWKHHHLSFDLSTCSFYDPVIWPTYELFCLDYNLEGLSYTESMDLHVQKLREYADAIDCDEIYPLIIRLNNILKEIGSRNAYIINSSVQQFVSFFTSNDQKLIIITDALMEQGHSLDIYPYTLLCKLIELWGAERVYAHIQSKQFPLKNNWLFTFFEVLPENEINLDWEQRLLSFFSDTSDQYIHSSPVRHLEFLQRYITVDPSVFVNAIEIILEKLSYCSLIVRSYLFPIFYRQNYVPEKLIELFQGNVSLLQKTYFTAIALDSIVDHDGFFLASFAHTDLSWAEKYADFCIEHADNYSLTSEAGTRVISCWNQDNFIDIIDTLFNRFFCLDPSTPNISGHLSFRQQHLFATFLMSYQGNEELTTKQKEWILHCIRENAFNERIISLFRSLIELGPTIRIDAIREFISINSDFKLFEQLELTENSWSGGASLVPAVQDEIDYLQSLLSIFPSDDIKFLSHRGRIQRIIESRHEMIRNLEVHEMLESRYD